MENLLFDPVVRMRRAGVTKRFRLRQVTGDGLKIRIFEWDGTKNIPQKFIDREFNTYWAALNRLQELGWELLNDQKVN